jgi:hypothetical protein
MEEIRVDISEIMMLILLEIDPNSSFPVRVMLWVKSRFAKEYKHFLILDIGRRNALINPKNRTRLQIPIIKSVIAVDQLRIHYKQAVLQRYKKLWLSKQVQKIF